MGGRSGGSSQPSAPQYGESLPGAEYTNPRDSVGAPYVPSYAPQTATPFLQSVMAQQRNSLQNNNLGLPSLQSMFNMPQAGAPMQPGGIQQLAPMAPYVGSTYRPDMSSVMARLKAAAPLVKPEQVSELDSFGKTTARDSVFNPISDSGGGA
jgi:hypothetical protein